MSARHRGKERIVSAGLHRTTYHCLRGAWSRVIISVFLCTSVLVLGLGAKAGESQTVISLTKVWETRTGAQDGNLAWADVDNDGDQDLVVTGRMGNSVITELFENQGEWSFSPVSGTGLPGIEESFAAWGDVDRDGYQDLFLLGYYNKINDGELVLITDVYRNNHNLSFSPMNAGFQLVIDGSAAWGDYDFDGDLDLLLAGKKADGSPFADVYRNDGGKFTPRSLGLEGAYGGQVGWGDYDNDHDLDFFISGRGVHSSQTLIYENTGWNSSLGDHSFSLKASFAGVDYGWAGWLDVDGDEDLDLLVSGLAPGNLPQTTLYQYQNGGFQPQSGTGLPNLWRSAISIGDADHDGQPDLLMHGLLDGRYITRLYLNQGSGKFTDAQDAALSSIEQNDEPVIPAWGHLDGDGTLDAAFTGAFGSLYKTIVLRGNSSSTNAAPSTPTGLTAQVVDSSILLKWNDASDDHTLPEGVTYNLRIGKTPGGAELILPAADLTSGLLQLPAAGNIGANAEVILPPGLLSGLPAGEYFWSVQAVDSAYTGSGFSAEARFLLGKDLAQNDAFQVNEDTPTYLDVLANDSTEYSPLTLLAASDPPHGSVSIRDGAILYTPDLNYIGSDSFTYTLDYHGFRETASVQVTVNALDDDPPSQIFLSNRFIDEGSDPAVTPIGTLTVTDPDAAQFPPGQVTHTFSLVSTSACKTSDNTAFKIEGNTLWPLRAFEYENPLEQQFTVCIRATDNTGLTLDQQFTIEVSDKNEHPPVIDHCGDAKLIIDEDQLGTLMLKATDADPGASLVWSISRQPAHGVAYVEGKILSSGEAHPIYYLPDKNYYGSDNFEAQVSDGQFTDKIKILVTVKPVLDIPSNLMLSNQSVKEDRPVGTLVGSFSVDAPDSTTITYQLVSGDGDSGNSAFTITGNQLKTAQVFPQAGIEYSIRVKAEDEKGLSVEKAFTIHVIAANDGPPVIGEGSQPDVEVVHVIMYEDDPESFDLTLFATDPDTGAVIHWSITQAAQHGTASVPATSSSGQAINVAYEPHLNYSGTDSFMVQAEHAGQYDTVKVIVTILPVEDPPSSLSLSKKQVRVNQPVGIEVGQFTSTDPDEGDTLFSYTLVDGEGSTDNHRFTISGDRLLTAEVFETAGIKYSIRVRTTDVSSDPALYLEKIFEIQVTTGNLAAPVIGWGSVSDADQALVTISEDATPIPMDLLLYAVDTDSDTILEWSISNPAAHGQAAVSAVSTTSGEEVRIDYVPDPDYFGQDQFEVQVSDGMFTDSILVVVMVEAVNDPPTLDVLPGLNLAPGAGQQQIILTGITPGPLEDQPLEISVASDRPDLFAELRLVYDGKSSSAVLYLTPAWGKSGSAKVTVTVSDGELEVSQSFIVSLGEYRQVFLPFAVQER